MRACLESGVYLCGVYWLGVEAEREGTTSKGVEDFCLKNGSKQDHDLALTDLFVPGSLDSALSQHRPLSVVNFRRCVVFLCHTDTNTALPEPHTPIPHALYPNPITVTEVPRL